MNSVESIAFVEVPNLNLGLDPNPSDGTPLVESSAQWNAPSGVELECHKAIASYY